MIYYFYNSQQDDDTIIIGAKAKPAANTKTA